MEMSAAQAGMIALGIGMVALLAVIGIGLARSTGQREDAAAKAPWYQEYDTEEVVSADLLHEWKMDVWSDMPIDDFLEKWYPHRAELRRLRDEEKRLKEADRKIQDRINEQRKRL